LYNDSTTIHFNETKLNATIDLRDDDTIWSVVYNWLFNNSGSLDFNETKLNATIDTRAAAQDDSGPWTNDSSYIKPKPQYPRNVNISGNLTIGNAIIYDNGSEVIFDY